MSSKHLPSKFAVYKHYTTRLPFLQFQSLNEQLALETVSRRSSPTAHPPTFISAELEPVYTLGRREKLESLTASQLQHLKSYPAEVHKPQRGGQTTFHGPGQLVFYPIVDLRAHNIKVRDWVCMLEKSVVRTLGRLGVKAHTTVNTGVWTNSRDGVERKISSLGLAISRGVASEGVAVNLREECLGGLNRITACGLVGREATAVEREGGDVSGGVGGVGRVLAEEIAKGLGVELRSEEIS